MIIVTTVIVVSLALALLLGHGHHRRVVPFRLDQFRPGAPLVGFLSNDRDAQRQYSDLQAVHDRAERC